MAPKKLIIDTDPVCSTFQGSWINALRYIQGIDDILALLLAFSGKAEDVEVLLVSLTFGNVEVKRYSFRRLHFASLTVPAVCAMSSPCSTSSKGRCSGGASRENQRASRHCEPVRQLSPSELRIPWMTRKCSRITFVSCHRLIQGILLTYQDGIDGLGGIHGSVSTSGPGERTD